MKHAVVGFAILLTLVNVSRAETDSSVNCVKDSTASMFEQAFPSGEGPPEERVLYEICSNISDALLQRELAFMVRLVKSDRIPASQGLERALLGCTEVTLYLGTTVQESATMKEAFLYTKSVPVSVDDTDEQLANKVFGLVDEMIAQDIAHKAYYSERKLAKEKAQKTGA
jgi:hypothetical protein